VPANTALLRLSEEELLLRMGRELSDSDTTKTQIGPAMQPDDDTLRALARRWLKSHSAALVRLICPEWRKHHDKINDISDLFLLILPLLEAAGRDWPVGVTELAAFLAKRGLDELCGKP